MAYVDCSNVHGYHRFFSETFVNWYTWPGCNCCQASNHPDGRGGGPSRFSSQFMSPPKIAFGESLKILIASFACTTRSALNIWFQVGGAGHGLSKCVVATSNFSPFPTLSSAKQSLRSIFEFRNGICAKDTTGSLLNCKEMAWFIIRHKATTTRITWHSHTNDPVCKITVS